MTTKKIKAVFYPIDEDMTEKLKKKYKWFTSSENIFDLEFEDTSIEDYFYYSYSDELFMITKVYEDGYFCPEIFCDQTNYHSPKYYLLFVLYNGWSNSCAEYSKKRCLTEKEKEKYTERFSKVLPDIIPNKLKLLEYQYYNCSECQDYYIENAIYHDNFYDEI